MSPITLDHLRRRLANSEPRRGPLEGRMEAAVAMLLVPGEGKQLDLLFIKRAEQVGDPWSGQVGLPGGRRDPGDADLLATVLRETLEETGISLGPRELLGQLDDHAPTTPVLPPVVVRPFVFGLDRRPQVTPSSEVDHHFWASLAGLPQAAGEAEVEVRGEQLTVPAYYVGSYVIWGMTHRIVKGLLDLAT